jgi:hypothetical protein
VTCSLLAGSTLLSESLVAGEGFSRGKSMAMMGLRNFSSSTTLSVTCETAVDGVGADRWGIQAVKLD